MFTPYWSILEDLSMRGVSPGRGTWREQKSDAIVQRGVSVTPHFFRVYLAKLRAFEILIFQNSALTVRNNSLAGQCLGKQIYLNKRLCSFNRSAEAAAFRTNCKQRRVQMQMALNIPMQSGPDGPFPLPFHGEFCLVTRGNTHLSFRDDKQHVKNLSGRLFLTNVRFVSVHLLHT